MTICLPVTRLHMSLVPVKAEYIKLWMADHIFMLDLRL
jgi:hypothetical protein